jgi:predicted secreted Zn-dependent protease
MIATSAGRAPTVVLATVATMLSAACASAPRNPVLDKYPAGVSGRTTVLYYDVHGRTFDELRADMRRLGPKVDGTSFVGETRSPMRWSWRTESLGGASCSIREVTVLVNAQITLPRWTAPADTEPGLATEWKRFLNALEVHESGHKDISAKAAQAIVERLRGLSGSCSQLSTRANDLARVIVERASEEQKSYDAITRHGLTQGTGFGAGRFRAVAGVNPSEPMRLLAAPRVGTVRGAVPASLDRSWAALPPAFAAIGLVINASDSSAYAAGDSTTVRGTLGRIPVSELLDCGAPPAGRHADSVDVALFVTSRLEPGDSTHTTVTNTVQAVARPAGGAPLPCRSRAVLERRLFEALARTLGAASQPNR